MKTIAVLSAPRVLFAENMFSTACFMDMKIQLLQPRSAFWERGMTMAFQQAIEYEADIILAVDYDTVFAKEDVEDLLMLMEKHPEADIIFGAQIQRECNKLMGTVHPDSQIPVPLPEATEIAVDHNIVTVDFSQELTRCSTGHFGLTAIRVKRLMDLPQPWFWSVPNLGHKSLYGDLLLDWEKNNCIDADIHFWVVAEQNGWKCYQANNVRLGHLQRVITWPTADMSGLVHQYSSEWLDGRQKPYNDGIEAFVESTCINCLHNQAVHLQFGTHLCECGCNEYLPWWLYKERKEKEKQAKVE